MCVEEEEGMMENCGCCGRYGCCCFQNESPNNMHLLIIYITQTPTKQGLGASLHHPPPSCAAFETLSLRLHFVLLFVCRY